MTEKLKEVREAVEVLRDVLKLAQQLHLWYLEVTCDLPAGSFNPEACKQFSDLTADQQAIDLFIAKKIVELHSRQCEEMRKENERLNKIITVNKQRGEEINVKIDEALVVAKKRMEQIAQLTAELAKANERVEQLYHHEAENFTLKKELERVRSLTVEQIHNEIMDGDNIPTIAKSIHALINQKGEK